MMIYGPISIEELMRIVIKTQNLFKDKGFFPKDKVVGEDGVVDFLVDIVSQQDGAAGALFTYYSLNSLFRAAVTLGVGEAFRSGIPEQSGKDFYYRHFTALDKTIEKYDEADRDNDDWGKMSAFFTQQLFFCFQDWMLDNHEKLKTNQISFQQAVHDALKFSYRISFTALLEKLSN